MNETALARFGCAGQSAGLTWPNRHPSDSRGMMIIEQRMTIGALHAGSGVLLLCVWASGAVVNQGTSDMPEGRRLLVAALSPFVYTRLRKAMCAPTMC